MPFVFPFIESVVLPPGLFVVLIAVSLLLVARRKRRAGLVLGGLSVVLLYLCSIAPVADLFILPLENRYPPYHTGEGAGADAVVVLGGGIVPVSPAAEGRASLAPEALKRLVFGMRIASATGLPLIYSGGIVPSVPARESEAQVALRTAEELGMTARRIHLESKSRNTWENAARVEAKYHPRKVILVTSAFHMPRSVLAFRRNKIQVVPAPTDYLSDRAGYTVYSFLPGAARLRESAIALKEYLGYLYYRFLLFHRQE